MCKRCGNCRLVDGSDPSPRPSPGGRGRPSGVTCPGIFFGERIALWLRSARSLPSSVLRPSQVCQREKWGETTLGPVACKKRPSTLRRSRRRRRGSAQRAVHSEGVKKSQGESWCHLE